LYGVLLIVLAYGATPVAFGPVAAHDVDWDRAARLALVIKKAKSDEISLMLYKTPRGGADGRDFWIVMIQDSIAPASTVEDLVSVSGPDKAKATSGSLRNLELDPEHCSFTGPRGRHIQALRGKSVLVTFNSRNWNNYPDRGVLVIWYDSETPQWLNFEQAKADWGITAEEWADPAGKLFGKKAPFQDTYE